MKEKEGMIFPNVLIVTAVDFQTGSPIVDVALALRLEAQKKNDYMVGPVLTDEVGHAKFTRSDCEREIAASKKMFLMDYYGDLTSCGPNLHIELVPAENLRVMIQQYEQSPEFWGTGLDNPEVLFSSLENAKNEDYEPAQLAVRSSEILKDPMVKFVLKRKSR